LFVGGVDQGSARSGGVNSSAKEAEVDIIKIPRSKGNESFRVEASRTGACLFKYWILFSVLLSWLSHISSRSRTDFSSASICFLLLILADCILHTGTLPPPTSANSRPTSIHRAPSLNSELIASALIKKSEFERRKCEITFNDYNLIVLISVAACPR